MTDTGAIRYPNHPASALAQFGTNVEHRGGNPGDIQTKELWDEWAKVSEAEKRYRAACERTKAARSELNRAAADEERLGNALRSAHEGLAQKLKIPAPPPPSEPVSE